MKLLILLISTASSLVAAAQPQNLYKFPVDSSTGKISFSAVIEKPGLAKELIYTRTKIWIAQTFNSAKDVINMDDKDAGIIKIKGILNDDTANVPSVTAFDMLIYIKEGKYKYDITNIGQKPAKGNYNFFSLDHWLTVDPNDPNTQKHNDYWISLSESIKNKFLGIASSLDKSISSKSAAEF